MNRIIPLLLCCLLFLAACVTNTPGDPFYQRPVVLFPGVGLGTIIAVVVSWSRNKSILWAIVHGILGWLYIIYVLIVGKKTA